MRLLASAVGSYDQVLDMPADECLDFLAHYLDQQEIEAYRHALLVWAAATTNASPEDRKAAMPKKPECLQDMFGD